MTVVVVVRKGKLVRSASGGVLEADSSSTLVLTEEMNLLVDTGNEDPKGLIRDLEPYGVDAVILTHGHRDHVGNARTIAEAFHPEFYAHEKEVGSIPVDVDPIDSFDPPEGVEIIETPGHTPGHISVVVGGRIVIAGDACPTPDNALKRVPPAVSWDRELAEDSLEKVLSYPVVIPGHGVHLRR
ncbi:MBL fold metallo-hydrolase [Methanopyrus sp. KOL6]|uniref:MBL fold metallo-hydrolase n=1 Tax=Methanopyrus sp. KOL6 TaxID=1937004 RepID=UPI000B4B49ED|nr:MBL fold metallo-hydrolase [Methanopyrus sp. KOL6]